MTKFKTSSLPYRSSSESPSLSSSLSLLLFVFLTCLVDAGAAVKCYRCSSENDHCNNPFTPGKKGVTVCDGKYCVKSTATILGISATERLCANVVKIESGCVHDTVGGTSTRACVCSSDYCNDSRRVSSSSPLILLGVALALLWSAVALSGASG